MIGAHMLIIHADGTVSRPGIVTPTGTRLITELGGTIAIKVPGHHYGYGRGLRGYAPAAIEVYRVKLRKHWSTASTLYGGGLELVVEGVVEFPAAGKVTPERTLEELGRERAAGDSAERAARVAAGK